MAHLFIFRADAMIGITGENGNRKARCVGTPFDVSLRT